MITPADLEDLTNVSTVDRVYDELMLHGLDAFRTATKDGQSKVFSKICHNLIQQYVEWNDYVHSNNIMQLYKDTDTLILTEKVKKVCNKILSKVAGKTEFEKELSLHDILARNVLYDDVAKDNLIKFHARSNTILGVLFYKTAVCEGIAKTFKFLLNALDIKCIVVKGKAIDDLSGSVSADTLHAWNMVKIDGQPYHVDLTWNISSSDKNMLCHYYFNLSDVDISIDHAISSDLPKCRSNNENYYYKSGLIVENKSDLRGIIYKRIQNGINTVEFKLCANVFENETAIMYFVQKSVDIATHLSKSFSVAYTANPQRNVYFFLWTFT